MLCAFSIVERVLFSVWVNFTGPVFLLAMSRIFVRKTRVETGRVGSASLAPKSNLSVKTLLPQGTQEPYVQLHPPVRVDTVRRMLFSGDALPMRAVAAPNYV